MENIFFEYTGDKQSKEALRLLSKKFDAYYEGRKGCYYGIYNDRNHFFTKDNFKFFYKKDIKVCIKSFVEMLTPKCEMKLKSDLIMEYSGIKEPFDNEKMHQLVKCGETVIIKKRHTEISKFASLIEMYESQMISESEFFNECKQLFNK